MNKIKIESVVFCEHIRAELGGKHSLLGAYAPELNVAQFPTNVPMALWISGSPTGVGEFATEFRALAPDGTKLIGGQIAGDFSGQAKTSVVIGNFIISLPTAGIYKFEWKFGDRWEKIGLLEIHHVPNTVGSPIPSIAPKPPS